METKETRNLKYDNHKQVMSIKITEVRDIKEDGEVVGNTQMTMLQELKRKYVDKLISRIRGQRDALANQKKTLEEKVEKYEGTMSEEEVEKWVKIFQEVQLFQEHKKNKDNLNLVSENFTKVNKDLNELMEALKDN